MNTATEKNNTEQTIAEVRRQNAAAYQAARGPNFLHSDLNKAVKKLPEQLAVFTW